MSPMSLNAAGLWQSLQLMKKVDANEEGIDKLTHIIENAMAKLKKVRKHTDRLDKQLAVREREREREGERERRGGGLLWIWGESVCRLGERNCR